MLFWHGNDILKTHQQLYLLLPLLSDLCTGNITFSSPLPRLLPTWASSSLCFQGFSSFITSTVGRCWTCTFTSCCSTLFSEGRWPASWRSSNRATFCWSCCVLHCACCRGAGSGRCVFVYLQCSPYVFGQLVQFLFFWLCSPAHFKWNNKWQVKGIYNCVQTFGQHWSKNLLQLIVASE